MKHEFTLTYELASADADLDEITERLGHAGCTDAMVGMGRKGYLGLDFIRDSGSADEAVRSAIFDVSRVVPTAKLVEVGSDIAGLTLQI